MPKPMSTKVSMTVIRANGSPDGLLTEPTNIYREGGAHVLGCPSLFVYVWSHGKLVGLMEDRDEAPPLESRCSYVAQ
jgi:hypothetical protein